MSQVVLIPASMGREQAVALLEDYARRLESGDALSGQFLVVPEPGNPGMFLVSGRWIVDLHQFPEGRLRIIGTPVEVDGEGEI